MYQSYSDPEFRLSAVWCAAGDRTLQMISLLAARQEAAWAGAGRLYIEYFYRGEGPYRYYADSGEDIVFPPPVAGATPVSELVVGAELGAEDITDMWTAFAGPDGTFAGRRGGFDYKELGLSDGKKILLLYADGSEKTIPPKSSSEDNHDKKQDTQEK